MDGDAIDDRITESSFMSRLYKDQNLQRRWNLGWRRSVINR